MELEAIYTNTNGAQASGPASTNNIDKLYIILDYNEQGERGNDADRDIIKFVTPTITLKKEFTCVDKTMKFSQAELNAINPEITKIHRKYKSPGLDTLTNMGWKGIYAQNIIDAHTQTLTFLGNRKIKTIVIRTHGGTYVDTQNNEIVIGMFIDNNWGTLNPQQQSQSGKTTDNIASNHLKKYLVNKNATFFDPGNYPDMKDNFEALIGLSNCVQDNGNFVIGSCLSARTPALISPLQQLSGSRVNMYGIHLLSSFPKEHDRELVVKVIKNRNGSININPKLEKNANGIAYVTKDAVFSDTTMLNPKDIHGVLATNSAFQFPVGWSDGDTPIHLNDLKLNKDGLSF